MGNHPQRSLADVVREIAAEQRTRGFPGRSAEEIQAEDDACAAEDAERDLSFQEASSRGNMPASPPGGVVMSQSLSLPPIEQYSVEERVELLGRLWDSLLDAGGLPPMPEWHAHEVAQRIARADAEPGRGISLDRLREELLAGPS